MDKDNKTLRIAMKWLDGTKWKTLEAQEVKGHSIASFMASSEKRIVAALMEGGEPKLFVCNRKEDFDTYKERGLCYTPEDMIALLGTEIVPAYVAEAFPDGTIEHSTIKTAADAKGWW